MVEVGIAMAQEIPILFLARVKSGIPFAVNNRHILFYDTSNPDRTRSEIQRALTQLLGRSGVRKSATKRAKTKRNARVFVSYSHADDAFLKRLLIHLKPLSKEGLIDLWVDTHLKAGDRWRSEIQKALKQSTVAILLVSADFLASDFITEDELPPLLLQAEKQGTRIVPLILKPCRFARDSRLKHFQAVNDPRDALIFLDEGKREAYYDAVAQVVELNDPRRA